MAKNIKNSSENPLFSFGSFQNAVVWQVKGENQQSTTFTDGKGADRMDEPDRSQWEIRCAFNGFCKKVIRCEASNAHRDVKRHQLREVTFSDLTTQEENSLFTVDSYFDDEEKDDGSFHVAGKKITPKLLAEALRTLPEEKRNVILLYYFEGMSDAEIAKLHNIPRRTIQYRRTSSFERLRNYLEERAYEDEQ